MNDYCSEHKSFEERIIRLERDGEKRDLKEEANSTKLNLILGGIIISPFVVALITLLIKIPR